MWRSISCLALLSLSTAALADFDYTFVEGSYGQTEFDDFDVDGDAIGIGGSFAVTDSLHLFGGYSTADFDGGVDMNTLQAGLGYRVGLSDALDVVGSVAFVRGEVEFLGQSVDDTGYGLGLGLRAMASPAVELSGGVSYVDMGDLSDGDTSIGGGFLYHFTDAFALGLSAAFGEDTNTYALNGRFSFSQ